MKNTMKLVKSSLHITKDVKIQDGHHLWFKKSFSVLGERRETQISKIKSPPIHLVYNVHITANFLSFHMSLVLVVNCGAGNVLHGSEISIFYFFSNSNFHEGRIFVIYLFLSQ